MFTSYGVMGRKTTVFGSLFAKKGMKRILNDFAAPQQHGSMCTTESRLTRHVIEISLPHVR